MACWQRASPLECCLALHSIHTQPIALAHPLLRFFPAEGVVAVFLPWLAPRPRLSGMQRQVAEEMAVEAHAARKLA